MPDIPLLLLIAGFLILLSILTSKVSERFGVPALLLFLGVGMLAGSDGIGGIHFDNALVANFVGTIALAYILFSGGLDTSWQNIRPVLWRGLTLSTLGVLITALLLGLFVWLVLDFSFTASLLLAAIVSSTDAAAVFSVLRSRAVSLKGKLRPLLELESGSNDPMAIFLTIGLIQLLTVPDASWLALLPSFLLQMSLGTAIGLGTGSLASLVLNRIRLDYEGLYPVLSMSIVVMVFGLAETVGGNGFLAVYLCGIVLGNHDFIHKRSLMRFHDGLGWLMQISMFLVLGLLVFPSQLPTVIGSGLLVSVFLMFVARPIAVYIGLWRSQFDLRERTLVAWTGLRGAVPIVLATFPLLAGYPQSELIFNIVFFVVLTSVLLQGKTLMPLARWLGVDEPLASRPRYPLEFERTENMHGETREFEIQPDAAVVGKCIEDLELPSDVLILLIHRGERFVVPRGQTRIEPHDALLVLAEPNLLHVARRVLEVKASATKPAVDAGVCSEKTGHSDNTG
ncbi:potassium/proton antiporter [Phycisphaerales bacterium AB-hyl4]|uniref:Potassium/proton antiporter n=1 Tax=Natronomicrosphaera hydrolytica TaxID=3242702 RepID=A0ABV4UBH4_9BACT